MYQLIYYNFFKNIPNIVFKLKKKNTELTVLNIKTKIHFRCSLPFKSYERGV